MAVCKCCRVPKNKRCPPFYEIEIPPLIDMAGTHLDWTAIPKWFVAVRCIICAAMWYITLMSLSLWSFVWGTVAWWPIYLTHWMQTLLTITVTIRVYLTLSIWRSVDSTSLTDDLDKIPAKYRRWVKTVNFLASTALCVTTLVAIQYWGFSFTGCPDAIVCWNSMQTHGANAILMWIDYLLSAQTVHYFYGAIGAIVFWTAYSIWNIIFEFAHWKDENGNERIYAATDWSADWKGPLSKYVAAVVLIFIIALLADITKDLMYKMRQKNMAVEEEAASNIQTEQADRATSVTVEIVAI